MKKKYFTILALLTVFIFVSLAGTIASLCMLQEESSSPRRIAANKVINSLMSASDSNWTPYMSDAELAEIDNCGDYVLNFYWTSFIADLLYGSSLQTAKISKLADELQSDKGKEILSGGTNSLNDYFNLFEAFGFTANDVGELFYDAVNSLVTDTGTVMSAAKTRLNDLWDVVARGDNQAAKINVGEAINTSQVMIASIENFENSSSSILTALTDAKSAINSIISAFYELSFSSNLGNLIEVVSSGTFEDLSQAEIDLYMDSFTASFRTLKDALTESETAKLNSALDLLVSNLKGVILPSDIFNKMIAYVRYIYLASDYIPTLCDLILNASDTVDAEFIDMVKQYGNSLLAPVGAENMSDLNSGIFFAKVLLGAIGDRTASNIVSTLTGMAESAGSVYEKNVPFYTVALGLLLLNNVENFDETVGATALKIIMSDSALTTFRAEYANYVCRNTSFNPYPTSILSTAADKLKSELNISVVGLTVFSREWYERIETKASSQLVSLVNGSKNDLLQSLEAEANTFMSYSLPMLKELSEMSLIPSDKEDTPEFARLGELFQKLNLNLILNVH